MVMLVIRRVCLTQIILFVTGPKQFAADARDAGRSCVPDLKISMLLLVKLTCRLRHQSNSQLLLVMLAVRVCQIHIFPSRCEHFASFVSPRIY